MTFILVAVVLALRDTGFLADLGFAAGFLVGLRFTGARLAGVLLTAFDAVAFLAEAAGFLVGVFFTCRRPRQSSLYQMLPAISGCTCGN